MTTKYHKHEEWLIRKTALMIYKKHGQNACENFGELLDLPGSYCEGCEIAVPYIDGACLICGQKVLDHS